MFDIIIIGGGPGGYAAAIRASQLGGKVALIESGQIGGTCVNRGCIPSKIWLRSAQLLKQIQGADAFGIQADVTGVDFDAIIERKNGVANDIRMGMESLLQKNGVKVISDGGRAILRSRRSVEVGGTLYETKNVIIATGSHSSIPDIPGLEDAAITTSQVFEMKSVPSSVLIWGAGAIEVEMATLLKLMGATVTLAMESPRVLPDEDGDTSQRLGQALRTEGIEILARHSLKSVHPSEKGYRCILSAKEDHELAVEAVLVGSRIPNTGHMGLESTGARFKEDGGLQVNERLETTAGGIYAVGDVTGGRMLSHAASAMGIVAAENAMGRSSMFPLHRVPRGIWTIPQVGAVGLSEDEAEKQGFEIEVGDFPYPINGLAMAQGQLTGAAKIISDSRYGTILGVHVVGAQATELVGQAVVAMQLESTINEFARCIAVHPTYSETLVEASRDAAQWALYLPPSG